MTAIAERLTDMRRKGFDVFNAALKIRTESLEIYLALFALLCGVWSWFDVPLFTSQTMMALVPQRAVAIVFTVHGLGHLYAIWRHRVALCRRAALASSALWLFVAAFLIATPPATHWSIPLTVHPALGSMWVYLRFSLLYPPSDYPR